MVVDAQLGHAATNATRNTTTTRVLQRAWKEVAAKERELLDGVTFAALVERLKGAPEECHAPVIRPRLISPRSQVNDGARILQFF